MHGLLTKIHDIVDKAICKCPDNETCVVAFLLNSTLRQHCEVWGSSSLFLTPLRTLFFVSEGIFMVLSTGIWHRFSNCLYLVCHSPFSMSGGKDKTGFQFNVQKQSMRESSSTPLLKKPCFETCFQICKDGRKSSGCWWTLQQILGRKEAVGAVFLTCCALLWNFFDIMFISYTGWYSFTHFW